MTREVNCYPNGVGERAEKEVEDALRTLAVLGQAQRAGDGYILTS